jgi:NurA-like 5'-3' nuclease
MSIFEIKNALKTIETHNVDYYLYDGSLSGDLIRPVPIAKNLKKEDILNLTLNDLKEQINNQEITSQKLINKYFKIHKNKFHLKIFLANIEKLLVLTNLLKHNKKIISISKTSISKDLFESNTPDIVILDKYTFNEGYSNPLYKPISNEIKHNFEVNNNYLKNLGFTTFYLRLQKNKNILKIELPYKASKEEIKNLIAKLKKHSTNGYPYLLKKAHDDVLISDKDINTLANIININQKSGREMLK